MVGLVTGCVSRHRDARYGPRSAMGWRSEISSMMTWMEFWECRLGEGGERGFWCHWLGKGWDGILFVFVLGFPCRVMICDE